MLGHGRLNVCNTPMTGLALWQAYAELRYNFDGLLNLYLLKTYNDLTIF